MDPRERSPTAIGRVNPKQTATTRFRELLSSQLVSLQGLLDSAFEQELDLATSRVTESERICRLAAETEAKRLENELQELREELRLAVRPLSPPTPELAAPAPLPIKPPVPNAVSALSPLLAWQSELQRASELALDAERADSEFKDCLLECSPRQRGLSECRSAMVLSEPREVTLSPSTTPPPVATVAAILSGNPRTAAPGRPERSNSASGPCGSAATPKSNGISKVPSLKSVSKAADDGRRTPQRGQQASRIPKPSTPSRVQKSLGESFTLEDLDDQRLMKLGNHRHVNGSPMQARSSVEERSTTPQGIRGKNPVSGVRKGSRDDSATNPKGNRDDIRTRQMVDKRTLRRMHKDTFKVAIREWQDGRARTEHRLRKNPACQVFVRMRPMFDKELQNGEFQSVSVKEDWGEVIVHNCLFHADLIRMFVHHQGFCFPRTFGPDAGDADVYSECGSNLVSHALNGQLGTIFMFGQTGSGKTYTMSAIMRQASHEIFETIGVTGGVRLKVFEIAGKRCSDLLSKQRMELKLLDDEDGRTNIVGATEAPVHSTEDFSQLLQEALARRATASHGRNEESSRSHCICIIDLPDAGSLILVDCAGTERREDTDQHSSERTRESAEINASLHALKECIRSRAREQRQARNADANDEKQKQIHVPYRGSYLTRVLHESFTRPGSYLAAFGTVSPASLDTEHTLGTLRTLQQLMTESGHTDSPNFETKVDVDPKAALRSMQSKRGVGAGGSPGPEPKPPLPPSISVARTAHSHERL